MNNQWAATSNAEWRVGTCTFALIRATLSNQRASVVVNLWGAGSVREKVWKGGGGLITRSPYWTFYVKTFLLMRSLSWMGEKFGSEKAKLKSNKKCSGKYILSQVQNKVSVFRFRSFVNIQHYFSQLCLMLGDRKYNNRLNSNHLEPRIVFNIFDPSSNLFEGNNRAIK